MFKIGDFSKLTNLTVRALHHYEKLELLLPEKIDKFSNYRYYSAKQLEQVNKIKVFQEIGLPLKTIKKMLNDDDMRFLELHYDLRMTEIQEEIDELMKKRAIVKMYQEKIKERSCVEKYNVTLKTVPERNVMAIRKIIPTYEAEHALWNDLHEEFLNQKVKMANPPSGMTIYHDEEYKEKDIEIEVQSNIVGNYLDTDNVQFFTAPEFVMASVIFNGDFDQMSEVTQALASWIEANQYEITGPMINIPHVSPAQDQNSENWVTEAGFIVKKREQHSLGQ